MLRNFKDKINCCSGSPTRHRRNNSGGSTLAPVSKKKSMFHKKGGQQGEPVEKSIFDQDIKIWGEYNFDFKFKVQG